MTINNKIFLIALSLLLVIGVSTECFSENYATGLGKDGEYVMPPTLAQECGIVLDDTDTAAADAEECFKTLLKEINEGGERTANAKNVLRDAVNESRIATLETMILEKIYAANYKTEVLEEFENKLSGSADQGISVAKKDGGHELADWRNITEADSILASQINSHLNNVLATDIMHKALEYISIYNASYLEDSNEEK